MTSFRNSPRKATTLGCGRIFLCKKNNVNIKKNSCFWYGHILHIIDFLCKIFQSFLFFQLKFHLLDNLENEKKKRTRNEWGIKAYDTQHSLTYTVCISPSGTVHNSCRMNANVGYYDFSTCTVVGFVVFFAFLFEFFFLICAFFAHQISKNVPKPKASVYGCASPHTFPHTYRMLLFRFLFLFPIRDN